MNGYAPEYVLGYSRKIGYVRVSTRKHNIFSQEDALDNAGCVQIFTDKISRKEFKRKVLTACMETVRFSFTA